MTDSVDRPGTDSVPNSVSRLAAPSRTDGRTDGLTKNYSPSEEISPSASPAGGLKESSGSEAHTGSHVYVVYWPDHAIIKIGVSEVARWDPWQAVVVATLHTCCMDHARAIEAHLLNKIRHWGAPAFRRASDARSLLGGHGAGYTECYRLVQSPHCGEFPRTPYDYERSLGLILPGPVELAIEDAGFVWHPIPHWDCERCGGSGWIETADGAPAAECDHRPLLHSVD